MAQTVHLRLTINGNEIEGESTVASMEREGTIECSSFHYGVTTTPNLKTGRVAAKKQHEPVRISKRVDKSTPLLFKALCNSEPVNKAKFMFFRPSPGGSGAEERFLTVLLENGYISSLGQVSEDAIMAGANAPPMMEEVAFVFRDITLTYEINGGTYHDRVL